MPSTTPPGTLQLDLSWSPLVRFLENKFKWAEIVASTKRVTLLVEDNTVATAAGIRSPRGRPSRDSSFLLELVARDIEGRQAARHHLTTNQDLPMSILSGVCHGPE
eukprot:gene800-1081_t